MNDSRGNLLLDYTQLDPEMKEKTSITISKYVRDLLRNQRTRMRETYDEIIFRLIKRKEGSDIIDF